MRNRILSGLSLGTIVAEAAVKSGALITANLALSQGKGIFALAPHDLFDKRYGGNVALIRDGAICLCGVKDIVYEYYENYGHKIANTQSSEIVRLPSDIEEKNYKSAVSFDPYEDIEEAEPKKRKKKKAEKEITEPEKPQYEFDASALDDEAAEVYNTLKNAGRSIQADELAQMCGMDISEMLMVLTDLEIEGAVRSAAGNIYTAN